MTKLCSVLPFKIPIVVPLAVVAVSFLPKRALFVPALILSCFCGSPYNASAQTVPEVKLEGKFTASDGAFDRGSWESISKELSLWDSWHQDNSNTGKLKYGPFVLEKYFSLYVAGSPGVNGIVLAWLVVGVFASLFWC